MIKGIKWSEELDKTFRNNYKEDPTLSWQYFGSSTGFMRQFPGKEHSNAIEPNSNGSKFRPTEIASDESRPIEIVSVEFGPTEIVSI